MKNIIEKLLVGLLFGSTFTYLLIDTWLSSAPVSTQICGTVCFIGLFGFLSVSFLYNDRI